MKKFIVVLAILFAVGSGVAFANHQGGHRHYADGPENRQQNWSWKGFCYSQRQHTCSSTFERQTPQDIANECSQQNWHHYYASQSGRDVGFQRRNFCND